MNTAILNVLLVLCSVHPLVNGVGFRGFTFQGLEEPKSLDKYAGNITENWITQPLDHFNHRDNRTWSMVIIILTLLYLKYIFFFLNTYVYIL